MAALSTHSGWFVVQAGGVLFGTAQPGLLVRLAVDIVCVSVLVRGIYFRYYRRADLFLTFFLFNLSIFLITYLLNGVELTMGAAFGLFAVFSMLRYRTDAIAAKDMTYLFLVIALGLIMSVSQVGWLTLVLIGAALVAMTWLLESSIVARREQAQRVEYENIKLIAPHLRQELIADLKARTGLDVHRVDVQEIDLLRDSARLTVYYYDS
jgi:hypothetical protein